MSELRWERGLRRRVEHAGGRWERVRYARPEAGGETRAFRLSPAGEPRGVVVSVHGAGNDALFAEAGLFERLLARGLELFAFDVDGHGRGGETRFLPDVVGTAVDAAVEESGALRRGLPLHGVGVSFGGSLLLHALPRLPFCSAALLCAPLQVRLSASTALHEVGVPVLRTLWRERRHYGLIGLMPSFGPVRRGTYPLRLGVPVPKGAFGYVEVLNLTLRALELEKAARATRCRVLVVGGGRDRLVPPPQTARIAELIPRAELLLLPGETHLSAVLAPAALDAVVRATDDRRSTANDRP